MPSLIVLSWRYLQSSHAACSPLCSLICVLQSDQAATPPSNSIEIMKGLTTSGTDPTQANDANQMLVTPLHHAAYALETLSRAHDEFLVRHDLYENPWTSRTFINHNFKDLQQRREWRKETVNPDIPAHMRFMRLMHLREYPLAKHLLAEMTHDIEGLVGEEVHEIAHLHYALDHFGLVDFDIRLIETLVALGAGVTAADHIGQTCLCRTMRRRYNVYVPLEDKSDPPDTIRQAVSLSPGCFWNTVLL